VHVDRDQVSVFEGRRADVDNPLQGVCTFARLAPGALNFGNAKQGVGIALLALGDHLESPISQN